MAIKPGAIDEALDNLNTDYSGVKKENKRRLAEAEEKRRLARANYGQELAKVAAGTKKKAGRPVGSVGLLALKFKEADYEAIDKMAKAGWSEERIAKAYGMNPGVFSRTKKDDEFLKNALMSGYITSIANVANALYQRAIGYDFFEETWEAKDVTNEDGEKTTGMKLTKRVKKHLASDVFAANAFLNNRDPDNWKANRPMEFNEKPKVVFNVTLSGEQYKKIEEARKKVRKELKADFEVIK